MPMDRSNSLSLRSSSSSGNIRSPSSLSSSSSSSGSSVLSIQCIKGSSRADEWTGNLLQTGDIVEEITVGNMTIRAPFKNGKSGVQKILHNSFRSKETSIRVIVRRGSEEIPELHACIVPNESAGKKQYMLRAIDDPNYAVGFTDRTETECLQLQASRIEMMVNEIVKTPLQDGYVPYPWERRMQEMLSVPFSSSFYSMLLLPRSSDKVAYRYNDLEDTLARANAWLNSSQASGVPIVFINIQTESLLTKISGETASSTVSAGSLSDLSNLASTSLYGFEDYHGVDIGVVRAVRLWFSPLVGEIPIEIKLKDDDTKLGFAISRTEEGFIYISSVIEGDEDAPSSRSGLSNLYKEASRESKLLVISRISNMKVLPWMVSPSGAVRCFDTVSLSHKLSLHRHARVPIMLHVFLWDRSVNIPNTSSIRARAIPPPMQIMPLPAEVDQFTRRRPSENQVLPMPPETPAEINRTASGGGRGSEIRLERDTAGESSFRFHEFSISSNWV